MADFSDFNVNVFGAGKSQLCSTKNVYMSFFRLNVHLLFDKYSVGNFKSLGR